MTNQEIFSEIGEMGTLMLLFLEMAGADGEVTESEIETVLGAGSFFTDNDLAPNVDAAIKIRNSIGFKERVAYLAAGLGYFAENLSAQMKKNILIAMAEIAKADGVIHDAESALFKMAASYLKD